MEYIKSVWKYFFDGKNVSKENEFISQKQKDQKNTYGTQQNTIPVLKTEEVVDKKFYSQKQRQQLNIKD